MNPKDRALVAQMAASIFPGIMSPDPQSQPREQIAVDVAVRLLDAVDQRIPKTPVKTK